MEPLQECSKSTLTSERKNEKERCQQVLYIVVDGALRLLAPFAPFLSEELWQRLPHGENVEESICVAQYPTVETVCRSVMRNMEESLIHLQYSWKDNELDERVALAMEIVKAARSLRAANDVQKKVLVKSAHFAL